MSDAQRLIAKIKILPDDTIEILSEGKDSSFWDKHGGVILAFLLTTVLGGSVAACYQTQEWFWQQDYAARTDRAKRRTEVTKDVLNRVSQAFTLNNHVINLTVFGGATAMRDVRDAQLAEGVKEWFPRSREWQVDDKIMAADVEANFSRPAIHCLLAEIIRNRAELVRDMRAFLEISDGKAVTIKHPEFKMLNELAGRIYRNVRTTTGSGGLLSRLSELMIDEMRGDQIADTWLPWARRTRTVAAQEAEARMSSAVDGYLCAMRTGNTDAVPLASSVILAIPETPELRTDLPDAAGQRPVFRQGAESVQGYLRTIAGRVSEVRRDRPPLVGDNYARVVYDVVLKTGEVLPSCDCLRFTEGRIIEIRPYFDPQSVGSRP